MFVTSRRTESPRRPVRIMLDPHMETADVDMGNNVCEPTRFKRTVL